MYTQGKFDFYRTENKWKNIASEPRNTVKTCKKNILKFLDIIIRQWEKTDRKKLWQKGEKWKGKTIITLVREVFKYKMNIFRGEMNK